VPCGAAGGPLESRAVRLSIVIPVYNEAATVGALIDRVRELPIDKELIIVNDGSRDGTREALKRFEGLDRITVHHSLVNLGKGASVRIGFSLAKGDIITIQDADLELDPSEFLKLIEPIESGQADVVFGSRFLAPPPSGQRGNAAFYVANRGLSLLASVLYGQKITDMETCYKLFRREVLEKLNLRAARFEIEPEITAQLCKRGFKIHEMPIGYRPRTSAEGKKLSWRDGFGAIYKLLDERWKA
jgi:glycosyltransferase involved in cell wall biosynthesis